MSTEIIRVFFHMKLNIKMYHWSTFSYPRHKSTDELFGKLLESIDKFVEVFIGKYGRPVIGSDYDIPVLQYNEDAIVELLKSYTSYLCNELPKHLQECDTDLLNIRDEMLADFNQTLYLFTLH